MAVAAGNPLRALFFIDAPHRLAGAQRSLLAAVRELPAHGVSPIVIVPGPGMCVEAFRAAGVEVRIVPAPPSLLVYGKKILHAGLVRRGELFVREVLPYSALLARVIDEEGAAVVHFNTPRGILCAGPGAFLARRPRVLHVRGLMAPYAGMYWTAAQAFANRFILVAKMLRSELHPIVRWRGRVVYNGVAIPALGDRRALRAALAARLGLSEARLAAETVFLSLSSTMPSKGLHHLLDAAARARAVGAAARFVLAGDGNDDRYLVWLTRGAAELGVAEAVHFVGFVDDTRPLLGAADALVLPSVSRETLCYDGVRVEVRGNEGLPRSILEAMAAGLPVVSSDTGGVREEIDDGDTGYVVPEGDAGAMGDALARVASDPAWRARAGARARELARQRFPVDGAASGLAAVLRELA